MLHRPGARRRRRARRDGHPPRLARPLAVRDRAPRRGSRSCTAAARSASATVRARVGDRHALHGPRRRRDDRRGPPGHRAGDHRPRLDHRHGHVRARSARPLPGGLRACDAGLAGGRRRAVVGAGIVGTAVARELAVRGVRGHRSSTGARCRRARRASGRATCWPPTRTRPELELTLAGLAVYDELEARLGDEARIRRKGALVVHREAATWAAEPARAARLGVPARLITEEELQRVEPALTGAAARGDAVPGDLQCDARAVARALAREAAEAGAEVRTGVAVEAVDVAGGRVRGVRTTAGRLAARRRRARGGRVDGAAGGERRRCALPLEPRKGQLVRLRAPAPRLRPPQGDRGVLSRRVRSAEPGLQLSAVVETTWEGDVLVGSSRERRGFDTAVDPAVSDAMIERAARLFPALRALDRLDALGGPAPVAARRPAGDRAVRGGAGPLARHRARGRGRGARPGDRAARRPALLRRAARRRSGAVRAGSLRRGGGVAALLALERAGGGGRGDGDHRGEHGELAGEGHRGALLGRTSGLAGILPPGRGPCTRVIPTVWPGGADRRAVRLSPVARNARAAGRAPPSPRKERPPPAQDGGGCVSRGEAGHGSAPVRSGASPGRRRRALAP